MSWDETWISWMRAMPRSLSRDCRITRQAGLFFGHLARQVRMGILPVYHTPAWLPFPTTQDNLYGPLGCHLQANSILEGFDQTLPNAPPAMRQALQTTLAGLPDRSAAPAQPPKWRRGRWIIRYPAPSPRKDDMP
ncbi:MAG TPA: hypothetical protein DCW68_00170 [Rhodospirillaceae bacterium]|nr:MAG: hypothetical protein A2018_01485 [Alphaproteobacteria bacterium GWF2_58_20]HAU28515.1 hypothetical protein [Rhodospirillaceae bacterium]